MKDPQQLKKIFNEASQSVLQAHQSSPQQNGLIAEPRELVDVINQYFNIQDKLEEQPHGQLLNREEISQLGEQTINCLADLADWAILLELKQEALILEEIILNITHWIIRNRGEIRSIEAIVNLLADKANRTNDKSLLTSIFHVIADVIEHTAAEIKKDSDKADLHRPWRMLNFNYAIVATRIASREMMVKAFDSLGRNLPEECPGFFEEGLKQSVKPVYGPEVKEIMTEYFKKWTTLH